MMDALEHLTEEQTAARTWLRQTYQTTGAEHHFHFTEDYLAVMLADYAAARGWKGTNVLPQ